MASLHHVADARLITRSVSAQTPRLIGKRPWHTMGLPHAAPPGNASVPSSSVCCTRRSFATTSTNSSHDHSQSHFRRYRRQIYVLSFATAFTATLYTRYTRQKKLSTLLPAKDCGCLYIGSSNDEDKLQPAQLTPRGKQKYNLPQVIETITRAGLVGTTKSVKEELDYLRKWHVERGYNGGLVVRDLSRPLFSLNLFDHFRNFGNNSDTDDVDGENKIGDGNSISRKNSTKKQNHDDDIHVMNQRECYYLYYEIHSNGETRQQIFCRGTTLLADVWTCLKTWFVYDEELGCHVHYGFNQHADRVVEDLLPLLVPPPLPQTVKSDTVGRGEKGRGSMMSHRATIEVCGHSLGGAVAMLVAIKLRKRGYIVTRVTSVAAPRFCKGLKERESLEKWLPKETIRVEDDLDVVTYLPPNAVSVGDKLWLVDGKEKTNCFMLPVEWIQEKGTDHSWVESVWLNLRLVKTLCHQNQTHRVSSYVEKLKQLAGEMRRD